MSESPNQNPEVAWQKEFTRFAVTTYSELLEWLAQSDINTSDVLVAGYTNAEASEKGNPEFTTDRVNDAGEPVEKFYLGSVADLLHVDDEGRHANPLFFAIGRPLITEPPQSGMLGVYSRSKIEPFLTEGSDASEPQYGTVIAELSMAELKNALIAERNIDN